MRIGVLGALALTVVFAACSQDSGQLEVQVVTGLVPGAEFASVETYLASRSAAGFETRIDSVEAVAHFGNDFAHGRRVAAFNPRSGEYLVRVVLRRRDGSVLVSQATAVSFLSDYVLRVHITRDCVGVVCPGAGGSELIACLNGQCVDPRCDDQHRAYCPSVYFCHATSECRPSAACAVSECDEGICTETSAPNACEDSEWCEPKLGCTSLIEEPSDGPTCGTICGRTTSECRASYWNCDGAAPVCTPLLSLAPGTECGEESVCDLVGACVSCVSGNGCSVGCARGVIGCSTGAPVCNLVLPTVSLSPTSMCLDVGSCVDGMPCTTNGVCDGDGICRLGSGVPGLIITPTTGLITSEAGGTAIVTVRLAARPGSTVVLAIGSTDTTEGTVAPNTLIFTSATWNDAQSFTITGVDDAITDGDRPYAIHFEVASLDAAYAAVVTADLSVTNTDDETPGITVTPTSGLITSEAGGTATFQIVLNTQPTDDVTISLSSTNEDEGTVSPASVVFTSLNWSAARTITVTGVDDSVVDGDVAFLITTSAAVSADPNYDNYDASDVSVTNHDNDVRGFAVTPIMGLITTEGGGTDTFNIVLTAQPTASVSVSLMSSNTIEGTVSPASVTFTTTNWSTPQTVTVTGVDDAVLDGDIAYTIVTGNAASADADYNGLAVADVSVTNRGVIRYVKASNTGAGDELGFAIALSADGNTLAVAAPTEASNATGIDGNQADNSAANSGAVYIFTRTGSAWTQQAYIKASNTDATDFFGYSVSLTSDGNTLAVGAPYEASNATGINGNQSNNAGYAGAAYVFTRTGSVWTQQAYIKSSNTEGFDWFGYPLTLSADGTTLAVASAWEDSNATGINGNQANNSATNAGAVYVFVRTGSVWTQQAYVKASNISLYSGFGNGLGLSSDGNTLAVGATGESSNATGIDGNQLNNFASAAGAAYVFTRAGSVWSQQVYIKASNAEASDYFGWCLALSSDGNTLAVGAYRERSNATGIDGDQADNSADNAGAAYLFTRAGSVWSQQAYVKASNTGMDDSFGYSVALSSDGDTLAVGAYQEASNATRIGGNQVDNSAVGSGAVYVFSRTGSVWMQKAYAKALSTGAIGFGYSVALSSDGNTLAAGAPSESSNATGVDGSPADHSAAGAGAVYVY
ncbi:MAG: hypothetical protein IPK60_08550 [Sandaracinaceae bacterium]|nr:hypothetical protein [Sandaracinaceae bacterium]